MNILNLGFNLENTDAWYPTDEVSLEAFWEFKRIGAANVANVETWHDTSVHSRRITQSTVANQPSYTAATGAVTFDGSDHLSTASSFSITDEFVIGFKLSFDALSNEVLLASNTSSNNFIRVVDLDTINLKFGGTLGTIDFNDGTDFATDGTKYSVVVGRDSSDDVAIWIDGTKQTDTVTKAGTFVIDTIGVRATDTNDFEGNMFECIVFSDYSSTLLDEVNTRLNSL